MNDLENLKETAEALGLDKVALAAYYDTLSPILKKIGEELVPLAKLVKIALAPIRLAVWSYESIEAFLSIRVTQLLAERRAKNIKTPPLSLSGPLVMNMAFSADEPDLREMYAKLLASAMDERTANEAHPSFVNIIQQLTADEAKILNYISTLEEWPSWMGNFDLKDDEDNVWKKMNVVVKNSGIAHIDSASVYINNLIRVKILDHTTGVSDPKYIPEGSNDYGDWGPSVSIDEYEVIELTAYGRAFLDACVVDNPGQQSDSYS